MNSISIDGLTKHFDDLVAVNNVSLSVKEGEIFGLLGPNGAGKSTTINMICGLLKASGGSITVGGFNVDTRAKDVRRIIGLVPQDLAIYDYLTARENVQFFISLYGYKGKEAAALIDEALEFTGLTESAHKKAGAFSGGMKRRLNIACGIAHKPNIVIMDEPTVGIDPQSRNHILESIHELNRRGMTVVYTTHYMEEAEHLCQRIAIMDHGKVIACGTSEELKSLITDRSRYVLSLEQCVDVDINRITAIPGILQAEQDEKTVTVFSDKSINAMARIAGYFSEQNIGFTNIEIDKPNLETVFLTLTGRTLRD